MFLNTLIPSDKIKETESGRATVVGPVNSVKEHVLQRVQPIFMQLMAFFTPLFRLYADLRTF